jgi:methionyl-tRNA formyltransferase
VRIWLAGQKYFGREVLRMLIKERYDIAGVSAPPLREDGEFDRLYNEAARLGLPLINAGGLNADTLPLGVDLIVCAHSYDFISKKTMNKTKLGAIGFHPSLLPRHRGRDALRWAIKMGDPIAGGSVYWLNDNVDGGPIAKQDWCWIRRGDTADKLWRRDVQPMGVRLLRETLADISAGRLVMVEQDEDVATWEPSWEREPLHRPDLARIGCAPQGYEVIRRIGAMADADLIGAY